MIPAKLDNSQVAELKNGKIYFRQKPISFDNHSQTMQEIVTFRVLLEASMPLTTIPDEHLPLIAKLVHESDKTLNVLTKSLQSSLVTPILESNPVPAEISDVLPASAVERAIKAVADRNNYGIVTDEDKPPAALCVWRWEVRNVDWLPRSTAEKAAARLEERVAAKKRLQASFDELSAEDKKTLLLKVKQTKASKGKEGPDAVDPQDLQSPINDQGSEVSESGPRKHTQLKKDLETITKEKEKQEKKAVRAEKEKKAAEETKRSAAVFANFFKPTRHSSKDSKGYDSAAAQPSSSASTSTSLNEFQATFKPFVLKKGAQLAPINWFSYKREKEIKTNTAKGNGHAIEGRVVQKNDKIISLDVMEKDASTLSPKEALRSFLRMEMPSLSPVTGRLSPLKSQPTYCVRDIMKQLTEAEVGNDQRAVPRLAALLRNRRKIPAKVIVFAENNRPGYLGTWTRASAVINPRRPFARDLLSFDYDQDSDAEWEEEVDEYDDVDSQDESEDDPSDIGLSMDDWLVDEDIDAEPMNVPSIPGKRKAPDPHDPPNKKRKVVPLIPFQKGPIWEKKIGGCEYEPFQFMRIQLFNDTPFPIDPFTFVSCLAISDKKKESQAAFAVPAPPGHLSAFPVGAEPSIVDIRRATRKAAHPQPPPKTTFPDAHVPLLLRKIAESNTNSFLVLVDSLFQEIKSLGIKKNALEVKLREVAEKDKVRKSWVVREDAWVRHGLMKSA